MRFVWQHHQTISYGEHNNLRWPLLNWTVPAHSEGGSSLSPQTLTPISSGNTLTDTCRSNASPALQSSPDALYCTGKFSVSGIAKTTGRLSEKDSKTHKLLHSEL
ncbi:uncharacterized protein LOC144330602 [Macaca mulatta]